MSMSDVVELDEESENMIVAADAFAVSSVVDLPTTLEGLAERIGVDVSLLQGKNGFETFHEQIVIGARDVQSAKLRLAYHTHMMFSNDLHVFGHNPDTGENFRTQKEYLAYITRITGRAVSTIQRDEKAISGFLAAGATMSDIERYGMETVAEIHQQFDTDRETGKPRGVKNRSDITPETAPQFMIEAAEALAVSTNGVKEELNLTAKDKAALKQKLFRPFEPTIWFETLRDKYEDGTVKRKWVMRVYDRNQEEQLTEGSVKLVMDKDGIFLEIMPGPSGVVPDAMSEHVMKGLRL